MICRHRKMGVGTKRRNGPRARGGRSADCTPPGREVAFFEIQMAVPEVPANCDSGIYPSGSERSDFRPYGSG